MLKLIKDQLLILTQVINKILNVINVSIYAIYNTVDACWPANQQTQMLYKKVFVFAR